MKPVRIALVAAALSLASGLAACQTAAPEAAATAATPSFAWVCPDGVHFSVTYPDQHSALVTFNDNAYRLPAAISGSGARYAGSGVEFWEHQGEARFTDAAGAAHQNCRVH